MQDINKYARELAGDFFVGERLAILYCIDYVWNGRFGAKTAGVCRYKLRDGQMNPFQIDVSRKYVSAFPEMLDSILLHEMIHAVLPFEEKHGREFKRYALKIMKTAKEKFFLDLNISVRTPKTKQIAREYKFRYFCKDCRVEYNRVRKPIDTRKYRCGACGGNLTEK